MVSKKVIAYIIAGLLYIPMMGMDAQLMVVHPNKSKIIMDGHFFDIESSKQIHNYNDNQKKLTLILCSFQLEIGLPSDVTHTIGNYYIDNERCKANALWSRLWIKLPCVDLLFLNENQRNSFCTLDIARMHHKINYSAPIIEHEVYKGIVSLPLCIKAKYLKAVNLCEHKDLTDIGFKVWVPPSRLQQEAKKEQFKHYCWHMVSLGILVGVISGGVMGLAGLGEYLIDRCRYPLSSALTLGVTFSVIGSVVGFMVGGVEVVEKNRNKLPFEQRDFPERLFEKRFLLHDTFGD